MVFRLMAGLGAAGVEWVLMMPRGGRRRVRRWSAAIATVAMSWPAFPELQTLDWTPTGTERDTVRAVAEMCEAGSRRSPCWAGRDAPARRRASAATSRSAPSPPGTNNAFPELREARPWPAWRWGCSRASRVDPSEGGVRARAASLQSGRRAHRPRAWSTSPRRQPLVGSRAVWRAGGDVGVFVALASPAPRSGSQPWLPSSSRYAAARTAPRSLRAARRGRIALHVPLAPGLVTRRRYATTAPAPAIRVESPPAAGTIALDGEREFARTDRRPRQRRAFHRPPTASTSTP